MFKACRFLVSNMELLVAVNGILRQYRLLRSRGNSTKLKFRISSSLLLWVKRSAALLVVSHTQYIRSNACGMVIGFLRSKENDSSKQNEAKRQRRGLSRR